MSDKPLKTLPCLDKHLELYMDRIIVWHPSNIQETIMLHDVAQITHLKQASFRAGCYNLMLKTREGKLIILPYRTKYEAAAEKICDFVRSATIAAV